MMQCLLTHWSEVFLILGITYPSCSPGLGASLDLNIVGPWWDPPFEAKVKKQVNSPWTSFCVIFCVRMSEDRRRTSPLNTHSCTGKSSPVRMMGFLLLSSMTSDVDSVFVLALICDCWFCCWVDVDLINLWLLKILLALLLLFVLEPVNVPVAASSSGSSKSSSLVGLWSFRRERIFSPVIFYTVDVNGAEGVVADDDPPGELMRFASSQSSHKQCELYNMKTLNPPPDREKRHLAW